jgi:hypothetical protein
VAECPAQIPLERFARLYLSGHPHLVELVHVPPFFRPVQRQVGVPQEAIGIFVIVRTEGDADARTQPDFVPIYEKGLANAADHLSCNRGRVFPIAEVQKNERKFIPAETSRRFAVPTACPQPRGGRGQQAVAARVA